MKTNQITNFNGIWFSIILAKLFDDSIIMFIWFTILFVIFLVMYINSNSKDS